MAVLYKLNYLKNVTQLCTQNWSLIKPVHTATSLLKFWLIPQRCFSSSEGALNPSDKMANTLKQKFPLAKLIKVEDVSGGCGSMYEIFVESVEFKGLSMVKQHRLINEVLKDDIKQMHGLRIHTTVPNENT